MPTVPTLPGISSSMVPTNRIHTHVLSSGSEDGTPVIFIHGNFSAATYFEELMLAMPPEYHCLAPDLRGYGDTEDKLIVASNGARDWAEDLKALSDKYGHRPGHIVGWSLGAGAVLQFALDYPELVSSLTLVSPVSPFGFGGTKDMQGTPCYSDYAGSGGGTVNPEFIRRITEKDHSADDPNSPRNVINTYFYKPPFRAGREEDYLFASLTEKMGVQRYPGDMTPSENWPHVAPGVWGPINALSPKYFNAGNIVHLDLKPPILWVRGDSDQIVADQSLFDFGTLGQLGFIPGWPGEDVYPPQPMVSQMRAVLDQYQAHGGSYRELVLDDCGHSPHIEQPEAFFSAFETFIRN